MARTCSETTRACPLSAHVDTTFARSLPGSGGRRRGCCARSGLARCKRRQREWTGTGAVRRDIDSALQLVFRINPKGYTRTLSQAPYRVNLNTREYEYEAIHCEVTHFPHRSPPRTHA